MKTNFVSALKLIFRKQCVLQWLFKSQLQLMAIFRAYYLMRARKVLMGIILMKFNAFLFLNSLYFVGLKGSSRYGLGNRCKKATKFLFLCKRMESACNKGLMYLLGSMFTRYWNVKCITLYTIIFLKNTPKWHYIWTSLNSLCKKLHF